MPRSKTKRTPRGRPEGHRETMVALDEMEENLRRLGLRNERAPATGVPFQAGGAQNYVASIRKAKEEAMRLRHEKEYRQFAAEEQRRENERVLSYAHKEEALRDVIKEAKGLLEQETSAAQDAVSRRARKATENTIRAEELQRQRALRDRLHQSLKGSDTESFSHHQTVSAVDEEMQTLKRKAKAAAVCEYCHIIASGVVELAMRVADNVYAIGAADGAPVLRVPRELPMSQWRAWVNELIFAKAVSKPMSDVLATTSLRELCDTNYKAFSSQKEEGVCCSSHGGSEAAGRGPLEAARDASNYGDSHTVAVGSAAEYILKRLVEMQHKYETNLVIHSVHDAIQLIKQHERKRLCMELDEVRRQHEAQCPEEVVPGWTHRMPPAGCFLYGDELSGLKKFVEALCGESAQEVLQTSPSHKRRGSITASPDPAKATATAEAESGKCETEQYRVLTPSMLIRAQQFFPGQGGGGGLYGGGGGSSFLMSGTKTLRGLATSLSNTARTKESRQTEEVTGSSQYIDALCDLLARELASVYQQNLQLVMRSGAAATEPKPGTKGTPCTLFLVGFPETEAFLRVLNQKLYSALELVEHEINRALRAEEAAEESPLTQPPAKGRSPQKGHATSHEDAGGPRKKGGKPMPSGAGKRGAGRAPLSWSEEENAPTRPRVYPPLCLLGTFLQYDVPSRRRRMQNACPHSPSPSPELKAQKTAAVDEEGGESSAEWTIEKLHHELIQQDRKMRKVCKTWCANASRASAAFESEMTRLPSADKPKKRSRLSVINKTIEALSVNTTAAPTTPSVTVPKVLFFWRKEDITSLPEQASPTEAITATIRSLLHAILQSITASGRLVRGQLAPPLRLSDYRFLPAALLQLVELQQRFQYRWKEISHQQPRSPTLKFGFSPQTKALQSPKAESSSPPPVHPSISPLGAMAPFVPACPVCCKEKSVAVENMVVLETEMHRAFCTFFSDLLQFITQNAFPPSLWGTFRHSSNAIDPNTSSGVETLSRTLHFLSVDKNYDSSREALCTLLVSGMTRLTAVCALLLHSAMGLALTSMGEALARLCFWARRHLCTTTTLGPSTERSPVLPPTNTTTTANSPSTTKEELDGAATGEERDGGEEGNAAAPRWNMCYDAVKESFLESVPRLGFDKVQAMAELLDGQAASFAKFQHDLWSYASCVQKKMLECFRAFIHNAGMEFNDGSTESLTAMASQVTEVLVAYLFAFSPPEKDPLNTTGTPSHLNPTSEICSSTITVSIGRAMASIRALRRCCAVASLCAARWIDAMYATALTIPPHGCFPAECRPTDIASIFCSPAIVAHEGCAPPPSLAFQLLASQSPALCLSPDEERECWWETEMEVILQLFSIYQKPVLNEAEFVHCAMQVQLNTLWRFLPPKAHAIAEQLGISLPFPPRAAQEEAEEGQQQQQQRTDAEFTLPWFANVQCYGGLKKLFLTEDDASHTFFAAVQAQQQQFPTSLNPLDIPSLHAAVSTETERMQQVKRPLLHVRDYLINVLLQRICLDDASDAITCQSPASGSQEPSTMQLRQMIKSLPCAVREQGPDSMPESDTISMEEWKHIRWWPFYEDTSLAKAEAFVQRYLLRLLTVCFGFVNGELCSRRTPFLPDILHFAAGTRGCQATLERYFHALFALDAARRKKLCHSSKSVRAGSPPELQGSGDAAGMDGPLRAFDFALSVDEAMFFFQRAGETCLRGPCAKGLSYGSPSHVCEPRDLAPPGDGDGGDEDAVGNDDDGDGELLPLATELTLLLEAEGCPALTLTLLGSSHWGSYITPRLTAIPLNSATATMDKGNTDETAGQMDYPFHCAHAFGKESFVSFV